MDALQYGVSSSYAAAAVPYYPPPVPGYGAAVCQPHVSASSTSSKWPASPAACDGDDSGVFVVYADDQGKTVEVEVSAC